MRHSYPLPDLSFSGEPRHRDLLAHVLAIAALVLASMAVISCGDDGPMCGNGWCEPGETGANCPIDCVNGATGNTGNGSTGNGSTGNGSTGNGSTGNGSTGNGGSSPPPDPTSVCGDRTCDADETIASCPDDCFNCSEINPIADEGSSCFTNAGCSEDALCTNFGEGYGQVCAQPCVPGLCDNVCASFLCLELPDLNGGVCVPPCDSAVPSDCRDETVCTYALCYPIDEVSFVAYYAEAVMPERTGGGSAWDPFGGLPDPRLSVMRNGASVCTWGAEDRTSATWDRECTFTLNVGDTLGLRLADSDTSFDDLYVDCEAREQTPDAIRRMIARGELRCTVTDDVGSLVVALYVEPR